MKKRLKNFITGILTSIALCLPVAGITAPTTTASAYSDPIFDHLDFVYEELSKIEEHSQFDPWFESYWEEYSYNWPNSNKLEIYSAFYGIWYDMQYPNRP